ncbi:hypothetical protein IAI29_11055, partial [Streptococcus pseudopneumoniae]|nr:hypothetical protein [Streptococcus pseudopneumoniae]
MKPSQLMAAMRAFSARSKRKAVTFIDYVQLAVEDDRNMNAATSRFTKLLQQTLK